MQKKASDKKLIEEIKKMNEQMMKEMQKEIEGMRKDFEERFKKIEVILEDVEKVDLTEREQQVIDIIKEREERSLDGLGVWELAEERDISYPAAFKLMQRLEKKGLIKGSLAKKGRKRIYHLQK